MYEKIMKPCCNDKGNYLQKIYKGKGWLKNIGNVHRIFICLRLDKAFIQENHNGELNEKNTFTCN